MRDVADDPDRRAVDLSQPLVQRVDVEQRLRGVLVLAVAGVDDRRRAPARDELRRTGPRGAQDYRIRLVGAQGEDGVLQRLALLDARSARREVHDVGGQALGRELEGAAGPRGRLIEEVQHHPAPQRGNLLDLTVGHLSEALGLGDDALDRAAVEVLYRQEVPHVPASTVASLTDRDLLDAVKL